MPLIKAPTVHPPGSLCCPVPVNTSIRKRPNVNRACINSKLMLLFAHVCLLMTAAGEFFTDDYLTQGLNSTNLPAPAPVSPRGFSNGSVLTENDTNLDSPGLDLRKLFLPPCVRILDCYTGMDHLNLAKELSRTYHFGSTTCSPFEFCGYVLALTFNVLGILSPGSAFFQARVCLLSLGLVVLPLCAHQQDSATRTSYCAARCRFKTKVLASVNAWVSTYRCGSMLLILFLWVLFVSSLMPQTATCFPVQRTVPIPWSDGVRIGEAPKSRPPFCDWYPECCLSVQAQRSGDSSISLPTNIGHYRDVSDTRIRTFCGKKRVLSVGVSFPAVYVNHVPFFLGKIVF